MKKAFTIIIVGIAVVLLASACTPTQYDLYSNISGTVVDYDDGEPISQALVTLSPSGYNTYTGDDGRFEFIDLDARQYTVTVQKTGYVTNRKTVTTIAGGNVDISLTLQKNQ